MNGSLLTVESNHFCVLKSRGAILNVYETGQYPVETPQRPLAGSFQQPFNIGLTGLPPMGCPDWTAVGTRPRPSTRPPSTRRRRRQHVAG